MQKSEFFVAKYLGFFENYVSGVGDDKVHLGWGMTKSSICNLMWTSFWTDPNHNNKVIKIP